MAVDRTRIERFLQEHPLRAPVAEVFRHAGFEVVWVDEEAKGSRWALYLKLPPRLRAMLGTGREVLVWVVQSSEFQARTVTQAAERILKERPRLSEDFAFVLTHDPSTSGHADETAETLDTVFIGFGLTEFLKRFEPVGQADLLAELRSRLYSRDLYNVRTAVTKADDFFGRKALVTNLASRLRSGGNHIGLFGLRKVGKTSLLYRLRSVLRGQANTIVAHVDIERIDSINPSANYLLWSIGEALADANKRLRGMQGLELIGKYSLFSRVPQPEGVPELFHHDIRLILESQRAPLILMFDEVELMSPSAPGSTWGNDFVRAWRLLRGLDQENPGRISYLVSGTNPRPFELNRLADKENPVFNYFTIEYLRPLTLEDGIDLLSRLGSRMGLEWKSDASEWLHRATGGHPALLRAYGSMVHRSRPSTTYRAEVSRSTVVALWDRFLLEESTLLSQLIAVLQEQYPDEGYLLETLALGRVGEFRELSAYFPQDTAHLVGYGLCTDPQTCSGLQIELLQTFIQRRVEANRQRTEIASFTPGAQVAGYILGPALGRPGGFARVYRAEPREGGASVALKIFDRGSLSALQRELDPLQQVSHPAVVKVVDFGQSPEGLVYMAMELLEGPTLKHYCTRTTRASEAQAKHWTRELLQALRAIHPDSSRVSHLRRQPSLSPEELQDLIDARHGFVHRDVKPENIIDAPRGPVLIDFNISVRASSPVRTVTATPGYLPSRLGAADWSPSIDIYQLGLTMLQVSLGLDLTQGDRADLRAMAQSELSPKWASFLLKLCDEDDSVRFRDATAALAELPA